MARDEAPPFARGTTWYNGGTIDSTDLGGINLEGKEFVFSCNAQAAPPGGTDDPSGRDIRVRVVRNRSGVNLKPSRLVHYAATDPYECRVDGYTYAAGDRPAGVVDEFLPAAGVPDYDLFFIVIDGPTTVVNQASAITTAIGSRLVPSVTGASATDDLAGRVALQDLSGATTTLGSNIQNTVGYAGAVNSTNNAAFKAVVHRAYR